jgi:hypothetical protein
MKRKKFLIKKSREILFYNESQLKQLLISYFRTMWKI